MFNHMTFLYNHIYIYIIIIMLPIYHIIQHSQWCETKRSYLQFTKILTNKQPNTLIIVPCLTTCKIKATILRHFWWCETKRSYLQFTKILTNKQPNTLIIVPCLTTCKIKATILRHFWPFWKMFNHMKAGANICNNI